MPESHNQSPLDADFAGVGGVTGRAGSPALPVPKPSAFGFAFLGALAVKKDSSRPVQFCYADGFQRFSNKALLITLTLLKAIAAPAITGFRKPNAASGMPTTL